jgi:ribosomal protein S17E
MTIKKMGLVVAVVAGSFAQINQAMDTSGNKAQPLAITSGRGVEERPFTRRTVDNFISACETLRFDPEAEGQFKCIKKCLDTKATQQDLLERYPNSITDYFPSNVTLFENLVLLKTPQKEAKKEAVAKYCALFDADGYRLFYLKDLSGTPLIHKIIEAGYVDIVAQALSIAQSCIQSKGHSTKWECITLWEFLTFKNSVVEMTLLHTAVCHDNVAIAELFLKAVDPEVALKLIHLPDGLGVTPWQLAEKEGRIKLCELFKSYLQ